MPRHECTQDCSVLTPYSLHWTRLNYKTGTSNHIFIWDLQQFLFSVSCKVPQAGPGCVFIKCLCRTWHGRSQSKRRLEAEPSLPLAAWPRAAEESGFCYDQGFVAILGLGPRTLQRRLTAPCQRSRTQTWLPRGQAPASASEEARTGVLRGRYHWWIRYSQLHKPGRPWRFVCLFIVD